MPSIWAKAQGDSGAVRECIAPLRRYILMLGPKKNAAMKSVPQDKQQIADVIEQYRQGFSSLDATMLAAIWDQRYSNIIYVPLEAATPLRGWKAVEGYLSEAASHVRAESMTVSELGIDVFGDIAYAFCGFHFIGELNSNAHIIDGRATFVLRRIESTWKIIHYHESKRGSF